MHTFPTPIVIDFCRFAPMVAYAIRIDRYISLFVHKIWFLFGHKMVFNLD